MDYKLVRMLRFDVPRIQRLGREVRQVVSQNEISFATDRRSQYVTVVRIGQIEGFNQRFEALDDAIPYALVHEVARSFEPSACQIGPIPKQTPDPLVVDHVSPFRPEQVRKGELHEQIAERCRIQNARVVENGEPGALIAHPKLLSLLGEFVEDSHALLVDPGFVSHYVRSPHAAMGTNDVEGDFSLLEELYQERP